MDKVYRLDHAVTKTQTVIQNEELLKAISESPRSYAGTLAINVFVTTNFTGEESRIERSS